MTESKIHIKAGVVEFSGEGDAKWLSAELDKLLAREDSRPRKGSKPAKT